MRSKCVNSRMRFSSRCNSTKLVWKKKEVSVITRILFLSKTSSRRFLKASKPSTLEISLPEERKEREREIQSRFREERECFTLEKQGSERRKFVQLKCCEISDVVIAKAIRLGPGIDTIASCSYARWSTSRFSSTARLSILSAIDLPRLSTRGRFGR